MMVLIFQPVLLLSTPTTQPIDPTLLPLSTFLLTPEDCQVLRMNYAVIIARILVTKLKYFHAFRNCVPKHIQL